MNSDVKKIWIEALRSGEYLQGQYCLLEDGKYCCLGVLTDLYIKENKLEWERFSGNSRGSFENDDAIAPTSVVGWSGIPDSNPSIFIDGREQRIAMLNDSGLTFNQMADVIDYFL